MKILDILRKVWDHRILNYYRYFIFYLLGGRAAGFPVFYGAPTVIGYYSKIRLGKGVVSNRGVVFNSRDNIIIGNDVHISSYAKIYTGQLDLEDRTRHKESPVVIGDRAWIGSNAIVLGGVTIGEDVVIAAGSVVTRSVLKRGLYAGVPAKLIREL